MSQASEKIQKLKSVFGTFSRAAAEPSQAEIEAAKKAEAEESAYVAEELPGSPVYQSKTGVLMVPTRRFDGSSDDPPWNMPEPVFWDWLRTVDIESVEDDCLSGASGAMWARYRNYDGQLRSALLRFGGVSRDHVFGSLGAEYSLEGPYDLLLRWRPERRKRLRSSPTP